MRFDKVRRGNPNQLSIRQHVFPQRSIARFASEASRCVTVRIRGKPQEQQFRPNNPFFCVCRGWDHSSERGYMKRIEDEFQDIAAALLAGKTDLDSSNYRAIIRFHSLWHERFAINQTPIEDRELQGLARPTRPLTQAQQENLEANGYAYPVDNVVPGRQLAGMAIAMRINRQYNATTTWALITCKTVEFVVPDTFGKIGIVPLSPSSCLVANQPESGELGRDNAIEFNRIAVNQSVDYCFARDFTKTFV